MKCDFCGDEITISFELNRKQVCNVCFQRHQEALSSEHFASLRRLQTYQKNIQNNKRKKAIRFLIAALFGCIGFIAFIVFAPFEIKIPILIGFAALVSVSHWGSHFDSAFGSASLFPELNEEYDIIEEKYKPLLTKVAFAAAVCSLLFLLFRSYRFRHHGY